MSEETSRILVEDMDSGFCRELAAQPGGENINNCFACGTCAAGCPVTEVYEEYNPRRIIRQVMMGMKDEVLSSPLLWYCLQCYRCSARCPQDVNFSDVMRALRYMAVRDGHATAEMASWAGPVDRLSQEVRRRLVRGAIEGRGEGYDQLQGRLGEIGD
jgi:heterodisulfide reductase subunit C2